MSAYPTKTEVDDTLKSYSLSSHDHNGVYLPLSGGKLTGDFILNKNDTSSSLNSKSKLIFSNDNTEYAALSATSTAFVVNPSSTSTANQFVYYFASGQLEIPGNIKENGAILANKYASKTHTHAPSNITGYDGSSASGNPVVLASKGAGAAGEWVDLDKYYALDDHTHKYAGSASAGGAATSANKLNN